MYKNEFSFAEYLNVDENNVMLPEFFINEEDTMDIALKHENLIEFPVSPRGPPERTNFNGDYNFSVEVKAQDTHKRKYLYSHRLNRVYVDMEENFSVHFVWDYSMLSTMYVRATTVFADQAQAEKRVERCVQHTHDLKNVQDTTNTNIVKNVLHSSREKDTLGVYYCGNVDLPDSWYSVLVEFTPNSPNFNCNHAYKFVCKSSCSTGINRRAIDIVFTLEDQMGNVYGRQTVGARVCSCPRRDMLRDESEGVAAGKKRLVKPAQNESKSKKIKIAVMGSDDEDAYVLPPLPIIGAKAAVTGLEVMLSMMEQAVSLRRNDHNAVEKYNASIQSLKAKIEDIKNGVKPTTSCKSCGGPQ